MEFKIKRLRSENKKEKYLKTIDTYLSKATTGFLSDSLEADNAILRKVIENYDHDFYISAEGRYIVLLDREIENSSGIENSIFSGGQFLLGQTNLKEQKDEINAEQVGFSHLNYKTCKSRILAFFYCKWFIIDSRIGNRRYFFS